MSNDWVKDINEMHKHYGFHKAVDKLSAKQMLEYYEFRVKFLEEELESVEDKITSVGSTVTTVKNAVEKMSEKNNDRLINWGIGIIGFLVATVGYLLKHYVFQWQKIKN